MSRKPELVTDRGRPLAETVSDAAYIIRNGGIEGYTEARALARTAAPDALRLLTDLVKTRQGSLFAQQRAATTILEAAGLIRVQPPGSAGTPEADGTPAED